MGEELIVKVLSSMTTDYQSRTVLARGFQKNIDFELDELLEKGFIEGISLSGGPRDHFRLTSSGLRFLKNGLRRLRVEAREGEPRPYPEARGKAHGEVISP
jgi:hypothetical protein